eukprot:1931512-Alexandrium_andersonii.AAC.1
MELRVALQDRDEKLDAKGINSIKDLVCLQDTEVSKRVPSTEVMLQAGKLEKDRAAVRAS